jgi:predicted alpha/beta hydrolase
MLKHSDKLTNSWMKCDEHVMLIVHFRGCSTLGLILMSDAPVVAEHILTTRDQTKIHTLLYQPQEPNQCAILIAPAMGFKQSFYRHYAAYLAEQGFVVLTLDYRGIGASLNRRLWGYDASLAEWGGQDVQAAISWLKRHYPAYQLYVVGHSIGALLLGLASYNDRVDGLLGIAPPNVYWGNWSMHQRPMIIAFWYGLLPLSTFAAGYFPAQLFKLGERLPKGVALDWARAGRHPQALRGIYAATEHHHFDDFRGALLAYSFEDDFLAPQKAVENFIPLYPNAQPRHHQHITLAEVQQSKLGHHGFFHPRLRDSLWAQSAAWLSSVMSFQSSVFS